MKFVVKTKNSPLILTSVYGTYTFNDGDITEFEPLVRQFPQYFLEVYEPSTPRLTPDVSEPTLKKKEKEKTNEPGSSTESV